MGERQKASEMTEVLPSQRYNAHLVPEDGSLTCSEAGVCKSAPAGTQLLSQGNRGALITSPPRYTQPRLVPFIHKASHLVHTRVHLLCTKSQRQALQGLRARGSQDTGKE